MSVEPPKIRKIVRRIPTTQPTVEHVAPVQEPERPAEPEPQEYAAPDEPWLREEPEMPQTKQAISLRVDRDVLEYFRDGGKGYQTRMNAVLRAYMNAKK